MFIGFVSSGIETTLNLEQGVFFVL